MGPDPAIFAGFGRLEGGTMGDHLRRQMTVTGKHARNLAGSTGRGLVVLASVVWIAAGALAVAPGTAAAEDESHYDRVSLRAERSRQVANDRAHAQLGITLEDHDAVELQYRVNEVMNWALEVATHYDDVQAQTGGYRTHPVYKNQLIDHWRATQELRIQSTNVDRVTELVRVLQAKLQLQSVTFSISPAARETAENELIAEALGAFKERAELVRENLGASTYRIVHVGIGTSGTVPAPMPMRAMSAMAETAAPPALEPGTSTVTVSVDGTLELRN
jgi:predicted secreted protein